MISQISAVARPRGFEVGMVIVLLAVVLVIALVVLYDVSAQSMNFGQMVHSDPKLDWTIIIVMLVSAAALVRAILTMTRFEYDGQNPLFFGCSPLAKCL
jgi:hypothetical protein